MLPWSSWKTLQLDLAATLMRFTPGPTAQVCLGPSEWVSSVSSGSHDSNLCLKQKGYCFSSRTACFFSFPLSLTSRSYPLLNMEGKSMTSPTSPTLIYQFEHFEDGVTSWCVIHNCVRNCHSNHEQIHFTCLTCSEGSLWRAILTKLGCISVAQHMHYGAHLENKEMAKAILLYRQIFCMRKWDMSRKLRYRSKQNCVHRFYHLCKAEFEPGDAVRRKHNFSLSPSKFYMKRHTFKSRKKRKRLHSNLWEMSCVTSQPRAKVLSRN